MHTREAIQIPSHREVGNSPKHLAEEIDDSADVVKLDTQRFFA